MEKPNLPLVTALAHRPYYFRVIPTRLSVCIAIEGLPVRVGYGSSPDIGAYNSDGILKRLPASDDDQIVNILLADEDHRLVVLRKSELAGNVGNRLVRINILT